MVLNAVYSLPAAVHHTYLGSASTTHYFALAQLMLT